MSNFTIHEVENYAANLSCQGVPYGDLDRTGHFAIWNMMKMFEGARIVSLYKGFLDHTSISGRETGVVILKQKYKLNPRLHTSIGLFTPVTFDFNLILKEVGHTSFGYSCILKDGKTGDQLAENDLKFVRIDRKTRRPIPLPDWYREKFKEYSSRSSGNSHKTETPSTPEDAFQFPLITRHSDTDRNGHINQAMYVKYCMDCATNAALKGFYSKFNTDMCLYPSTDWDISYNGEALAGDKIVIFTWQDKDDVSKIMFSIELKGKHIFFAKAIFVPIEEKKLTIGKL